jgi:putative cardiolipin synthase
MWRHIALAALVLGASGCSTLPDQLPRTPSYALAATGEATPRRLAEERSANAVARNHSGFQLLDTADDAFAGRLALIDSAQRSLDLQYYAIHADASTEVLLQRLRDAARRGVRVRILLDDFNAVGADAQVLQLAFEPGVEMRLFNPLAGLRESPTARIFGSLLDFDRIQKRMHNKLFVADNTWGITGGRNLGNAYFGSGDKSNFIDLDVLAVGKIVQDMSASFDRFWNDPLAFPVRSLVSRAQLDGMKGSAGGAIPPAPSAGRVLPGVSDADLASAQRPPMDLQRVPLTWAPALLLADAPGKIGPGDDEVDAGETVVDGLLNLMGQARQEVLIVSPYFVPGAPMMEVFAALRARQVRVRVLTNSLASNDAPAAHAGYRRYRTALVAMGVEVHELRSTPQQDGSGRSRGNRAWLGSGVRGSGGGASLASLHSKAVVIDRRLSAIGSMNLDLRSQRENSEVALLVRSPVVAAATARLIEGAFANSAYRVALEDGALRWRAPAGASFGDTTSEPDAGAMLQLLVEVLSPFSPDEML